MSVVQTPFAPVVKQQWETLLGRLWIDDQKSPWVIRDGFVWRFMPHGLATKSPAPATPSGVSLLAKPFRSFTTPPVVNGAGVFDARGNRLADWEQHTPSADWLPVRWEVNVSRIPVSLPASLAKVPIIEKMLDPALMDFTLFDDYLAMFFGRRTMVLSLSPPKGKAAETTFLQWLQSIRGDHRRIGEPLGPFNWPSNMLTVFREAAKLRLSLAACWEPSDVERRCSSNYMLVSDLDGTGGYAVSAVFRSGEIFRHQLVEGALSRPLAQAQAKLWRASYDELYAWAGAVLSGDAQVQKLSAEEAERCKKLRERFRDDAGGLGAAFKQAASQVLAWRQSSWMDVPAVDEMAQIDKTTAEQGPYISRPYVALAFNDPQSVRAAWQPPHAHHLLWNSGEGVAVYTYSVLGVF